METMIRNDGKPARRSLGGSPAGTPPPATTVEADWRPGIFTWQELVETGPKGDPQATMDRRADFGQLVIHQPYRREPLPGNANYAPREDIRAQMHGRGVFGRLVLHRRKPLSSPERDAVLGIKYVDHPMTGGNTVRRATPPWRWSSGPWLVLDEYTDLGYIDMADDL